MQRPLGFLAHVEVRARAIPIQLELLQEEHAGRIAESARWPHSVAGDFG
jgi:hypothetical protein